MSDGDDNKKHRHDIGNPDHAAKSTALVTGGIQLALALCIGGTIAVIIWLASLTP